MYLKSLWNENRLADLPTTTRFWWVLASLNKKVVLFACIKNLVGQ